MRVTEEMLSELEMRWDDAPRASTRVVGCPEDLRVIRDFFLRSTWSDLPHLARAAAHRTGVGINGSGFRYAGSQEEDEEPFEGVELYDPLGSLYLEEGTFERLLSRYFRVVIEGLERTSNPAVTAPWWPAFVEAAGAVEERVGEDARRG